MARPFLKWAGGKGKLAPRIIERVPAFGRYHEPFAGAGAVFFAMQEAGKLHGGAALADFNADLIGAFRAVRDDVDTVTSALGDLEARYLAATGDGRKAAYYAVRAQQLEAGTAAAAARLIFLNRTCYNGLYRVNAAGRFNVPHGRYARPRILDDAGLHAGATALAGVQIDALDFEAACRQATPGDLVYLDPPYQPLSPTSSFTAYTSADFGAAEQRRLRDVFDDLTRRGVYGLLSNSDHPAICELYAGRGYGFEQVAMSRAINSNGRLRAPIAELLIDNFVAVRGSYA